MHSQVSPSNILLFHLGVVESLLCIIFLIFAVPLLSRNDEIITVKAICTIHGFLITLLHPIALWTVCGLNCDRYYAIAAPLHYNAIFNPKKVTSVLCMTLCASVMFKRVFHFTTLFISCNSYFIIFLSEPFISSIVIDTFIVHTFAQTRISILYIFAFIHPLANIYIKNISYLNFSARKLFNPKVKYTHPYRDGLTRTNKLKLLKSYILRVYACA